MNNEIGTEILQREGLTNLLQDEEDIEVISTAQKWLEEEKIKESSSASFGGGGRKRKTKKSKKTRKSKTLRKKGKMSKS